MNERLNLNMGRGLGTGLGSQAHPDPQLQWSTTCNGNSADTSPMELSALGAHLQVCSVGSRRLQAVQRGALALHGFVAARLVSTLAVLLLALGGLSLFF